VLSGIDGQYAAPAPSDDARNKEKASQSFESFFITYMLKVMRETVPKTGLFDGGSGEGIYTSLLDENISDAIAGSGGLGLGRLIEKNMSDNSKIDSIDAHGGLSRLMGYSHSLIQSPPIDHSSLEAATSNEETINGNKTLNHMELPVHGIISSVYGLRQHPITHDLKFHEGIDIAAPKKTMIYPAMAGEVIFSGWKEGYGNVVMLHHMGGLTTLYAHNDKNLVSVGDKVVKDQAIGMVGDSGRATGPHLHFEVQKDGRSIDPLSLFA
jgi:murein DD-endopeptidase MepM/ murein hydrolase activator NlpD